MSNQHTPAPWNIRTARNLTAITTPKGEMQLSLHGVCDGLKPLSCDIQEWEANARLISSAPELLEALKLTWAIVDSMRKPGINLYVDPATVEKVNAVLAKAAQ